MSGRDEQAEHGRWRLGDRLAVSLFRLTSGLMTALPLPLAYGLARLGGELYFWLNPGHSGHAVANLAVVLGQHPTAAAVRRCARRSFRLYACYLVDFLRLPTLAVARRDDRVLSEGWEHLDRALADGRGALIVAAHFGSWDRAAQLLAQRGYRAHLVVDRFRPAALDSVIQRTRCLGSVGVIAAEAGAGLRQIYTALGRNEIVVLLIDRPLVEGGTAIRFFGRPTRWPSGPAALALRTGAPLLHAYLLRRPDQTSYQGRIEPLARPRPAGDRRRDEQAIMQTVADALERLIQTHPEQWYMFRPMWSAHHRPS